MRLVMVTVRSIVRCSVILWIALAVKVWFLTRLGPVAQAERKPAAFTIRGQRPTRTNFRTKSSSAVVVRYPTGTLWHLRLMKHSSLP